MDEITQLKEKLLEINQRKENVQRPCLL
jgi:hypothetical protein